MVRDNWFLDIGFQKQLFADDYIVTERRDLVRELGQATKINDGKPIFDDAWWPGAVLYDEGKFKMWYQATSPVSQHATLHNEGAWEWSFFYAESHNGLDWQRKEMVKGLPDLGSPIYIDPHETDPAHRYKTAQRLNPSNWASGDWSEGIRVALGHSADGIQWTLYNDGKAVIGPSGDFTNCLLWDEAAGVYRLYQRDEDLIIDGVSRGARLLINPDIKGDPTNWTAVRSWKFNRYGRDEYLRRQIYHMSVWPYEGFYFGLPNVYEWPGDLSEGPYNIEQRHERDIMNFYLAPSRNGIDWDFDWVYQEKPLIPRGPSGSYDQDAVYQCPTVITYQDKHWFYYSGGRERHNAAPDHYYMNGWATERYPGAAKDYAKTIAQQYNTCLATLRLDGMVCIAASGERGAVTTRPFRLDGTNILVNVDAREGNFQLEVLDPPQLGTPIPGFSGADALSYPGVDELRLRPRWKRQADLSALKGRVIRLRFHLDNAKLYSFQVQP